MIETMRSEKVAGKIVLFNYPFDKQMAAEGRSSKLMAKRLFIAVTGRATAARQGAVACLIRSVGGADYRLPHTGMTNYAKDAPKIPPARDTAEDADLIVDLLRQEPVKRVNWSHARNSA